MSEGAIDAAAAPAAPWRGLAGGLSALAALTEIERIHQERTASPAWTLRRQAKSPEGDDWRFRFAALEVARLILADIVAAERAARGETP